jgi:hypothetical protein
MNIRQSFKSLIQDHIEMNGQMLNPRRVFIFIVALKLLKPIGYGMHQQVEYFNNRTLCPHCIYVFCVCLRTNSDRCHLHKKLIGFYNRDEKCLQRGTDWVFK